LEEVDNKLAIGAHYPTAAGAWGNFSAHAGQLLAARKIAIKIMFAYIFYPNFNADNGHFASA
jgi:hypothetical protein